VIVVATPAPEHRSDVPVDRLDLPEGNLDVAVGEDAVEVAAQELSDRVEDGKALPAQRPNPGRQKAPRRPLVGVIPEVRQLLLEQMRFGEATVEGEQVPEFLTLAAVEIAPGAEQQPPLAPQQCAFR